MYGWRGRLGLVVPSSNTTNEPEFHRHLPEGVSLHAARMHLEDATADALEAMADEVERCADLLDTADVDAVAYGCTTGSLVKDAGHDEEIRSRIAERIEVPAVATAASVKRAFDALDLRSLAIATPYVRDWTTARRRSSNRPATRSSTSTASGSRPTPASGAGPPRSRTDRPGASTTATPTACSSAARTTARSRS
jgi:maleate isomerase